MVSDHRHRLQTVYDERFVRDYGPWRPVVAQAADKFLACGVLDHGFARIRLERFDEDQAAGMLTRPYSGFHVHPAVWVPEDDRAFATRLARDCARNPVALERLPYDRRATAVTSRSDTSEGPTAGTETADPLEVLARVLVHLPDTGQVTTRYSGWYANRLRGMRGKAAPADGRKPYGGAPAAALRGCPSRVSRLPGRDADRRVHHADVGD